MIAAATGPTSESTSENGTTLDSTIQKFCNAEQLSDKLEIREETEEEKQARLEMEAEVKKMLENLPPYVKRVVRTVKPLGKVLFLKLKWRSTRRPENILSKNDLELEPKMKTCTVKIVMFGSTRTLR